jgi:hypothetical protein
VRGKFKTYLDLSITLDFSIHFGCQLDLKMASVATHPTNNDTSPDSIPNTTKNDTRKVICLNVGGTRYEVSRSLIEMYSDTKLARMISEPWCNGDDQEVFLDGNGPRFQHVLDYMRDQKTTLSMYVTKESILTELEYVGVANVPLESIDQEKASKQVLEHVKATQNRFKETLVKLQDSLGKSRINWLSTKVASMIYLTRISDQQLILLFMRVRWGSCGCSLRIINGHEASLFSKICFGSDFVRARVASAFHQLTGRL